MHIGTRPRQSAKKNSSSKLLKIEKHLWPMLVNWQGDKKDCRRRQRYRSRWWEGLVANYSWTCCNTWPNFWTCSLDHHWRPWAWSSSPQIAVRSPETGLQLHFFKLLWQHSAAIPGSIVLMDKSAVLFCSCSWSCWARQERDSAQQHNIVLSTKNSSRLAILGGQGQSLGSSAWCPPTKSDGRMFRHMAQFAKAHTLS